MTTETDIKHKRRKIAWESLPIHPRVSWEEFKRIHDRSSSTEQAVLLANKAARRKSKQK